MRRDPDGYVLVEMLTYKRPYDTGTEREFCRRYLEPLGATPDAFGNYMLRIGDAPVLWSSHTDTVHRTEGRQRLRITAGGMIHKPADGDGECLGADCTTGVWLMREMVIAGVEGLYIWHAGEERGCLGSNFILEYTPEVLTGIQYAIAFDRKGRGSIITHQCGRRTASDSFAESLAAGLNMALLPDDGGIFTDTEVYGGVIPECTNVSVGYERAHSNTESQDIDFACLLREALLELDLTALVVARVPEPDPWLVREDSWWWDDDEFCWYCGDDIVGVRERKHPDPDPANEGLWLCEECYAELYGMPDYDPNSEPTTAWWEDDAEWVA
jgi:hypothetical protein